MKTRLYKKDHKGALRFWQVECNYGTNELEMEYGIEGGEVQTKYEEVEANSFRDEEEQLEQRFATRVHNKKKAGYLEDREEALTREVVKNELGLPKPMLAHRYDKQKEVDMTGAMVQLKYDGHRCMIANVGGDIIAYSKNGIEIVTIPHIIEALKPALEDGMIVDGELYHHGTKLQRISSWVKKSQEESKKLVYVIYDLVGDLGYHDRFGKLTHIFHILSNANTVSRGDLRGFSLEDIGLPLVLARTRLHVDAEALPELYKDARLGGFEGLIVRKPNSGYEEGKRTKNLLKVKTNTDGSYAYDDEFVVVNILKSKDGWARLECQIGDNPEKTFKVSAPGTMEEKFEVFKNKEKYLGRTIKVEFSDYTKDLKPFHPVAVCWRDKLNE